MKVLFLEDDENRISKARQGFIGHRLYVARTVHEAVALLSTIRFDIASLDHDLGGEQMAASDNNSGYIVAQLIAGMSPQRRPVTIVHTFNPVGAEKMMNCMVVSCARAMFDTDEYWRLIRRFTGEPETSSLPS